MINYHKFCRTVKCIMLLVCCLFQMSKLSEHYPNGSCVPLKGEEARSDTAPATLLNWQTTMTPKPPVTTVIVH